MIVKRIKELYDSYCKLNGKCPNVLVIGADAYAFLLEELEIEPDEEFTYFYNMKIEFYENISGFLLDFE